MNSQPILQGLTQRHWNNFDDCLILANNINKPLMMDKLLDKLSTEELLMLFRKTVFRLNNNNKQAVIRFLEECKLAKV